MWKFLSTIPKTTIATTIGALVIYAVGRWYIVQDTAELISAIMVALGASANLTVKKYAANKPE